MRELNNKDFDQAFKERMTESLPEFEESAWLKMEKKLRKKDRLVFYRNASIVLLFLSFGLGFYLINQKSVEKLQVSIVKPLKNKTEQALVSPTVISAQQVSDKQVSKIKPLFPNAMVKQNDAQAIAIPFTTPDSNSKNRAELAAKALEVITIAPSIVVTPTIEVVNPPDVDQKNTDNTGITALKQNDEKPQKAIRIKRKIPISLAISAGPDFNSTTSLADGKVSAALGLSVGVGLTKKLSVQTGLVYGSKNYAASNYDYTFNNPNTRAIVESIQAACKVLEIPLRASYNINENEKRSIELNAGLSSYLMLKENYVFKYTAASGRKDRVNDLTNANQHFLSVVELSATYNIKLKNKNLALGIEPYVKIPLSGVGEGNVPLKSSGLSFKLRYDFNKK